MGTRRVSHPVYENGHSVGPAMAKHRIGRNPVINCKIAEQARLTAVQAAPPRVSGALKRLPERLFRAPPPLAWRKNSCAACIALMAVFETAGAADVVK